MLKTLTQSSDHKQVFQSVSPTIIVPGLSSLYLHMQNSMNAYQFSLGLGNLSTLGVLIGPSIVFALTDAMWTKYGIGKALGSDLAATNIYYKATSNLDSGASPDDPKGLYQDWSAQAVLKRGRLVLRLPQRHHRNRYGSGFEDGRRSKGRTRGF